MLSSVPKEAEEILYDLENQGFEAYLVGGCVRDMLMEIPPKDFDICTSALPEQVCSIFKKTVTTGIAHGTVTVVKNHIPFEVTTFRIESNYTDHRHPDSVCFSSSLVEDLRRRDFTINALAYHPRSGVIDPFNGIRDIKVKLIRTVGSPEERFGEDALRMLRAIRFQARFGFDIHPETNQAIQKMADTILHISRERVLAELNGILSSPYPERFSGLFKTNLIKYIIPSAIPDIPDMEPLKLLPNRLPLRWAAVIWRMGFRDIATIRDICNGLKMSNGMKKHILGIAEELKKPLPKNAFALRFTLSNAGIPVFLDSLKILRTFNVEHTHAVESMLERIISEKNCIHPTDMAISGKNLITNGIKPGKQLGEILEMLFLCVLEKPELNQKDLLMELPKYAPKIFR